MVNTTRPETPPWRTPECTRCRSLIHTHTERMPSQKLHWSGQHQPTNPKFLQFVQETFKVNAISAADKCS